MRSVECPRIRQPRIRTHFHYSRLSLSPYNSRTAECFIRFKFGNSEMTWFFFFLILGHIDGVWHMTTFHFVSPIYNDFRRVHVLYVYMYIRVICNDTHWTYRFSTNFLPGLVFRTWANTSNSPRRNDVSTERNDKKLKRRECARKSHATTTLYFVENILCKRPFATAQVFQRHRVMITRNVVFWMCMCVSVYT